MTDLSSIIRNNPGCVAFIDNDCWSLYSNKYYIATDADWELDPNLDKTEKLYSSQGIYGEDLLIALGKLANINIQKV